MIKIQYQADIFEDLRARWFIDFLAVASRGGQNIYNFQGWILSNSDENIDTITIEQNGTVVEHFLTVPRPDVVDAYGTDNRSSKEINLVCGFDIPIPVVGVDFKVGVKISGVYSILAIVKPSSSEVIIGSDGWLYLDNDTNSSPQQFTGEYEIDEQWLAEWGSYFSSVERFFDNTCKYTFLIAPSKEEILPAHYPRIRGENNLIDRLMNAYGGYITWPAVELKRHRYLCYDSAETHWTEHGANLAFNCCMSSVGEVEISQLEPAYRIAQTSGDLGDKVIPVLASVRLQTIVQPTAILFEDNEVINHGAKKRYENSNPFTSKRVIIFGGSSANYMLPHVISIFKETLFVHTTGSIDMKIVLDYKPDLVIMQTNQRFITRPPAAFVNIEDY
ncbi:MAG: hypothetical protein EOO85_19220 [Pedobacter sp.]|nr:MAG: hypothetical protein EOO85_19220 [Pedobacter sp.]